MSISNEDLSKLVRKHPVSFACGAVVVVLGLAAYLRSGGVAELEARLVEQTRQGERQQTNLKHSAQLPDHVEAVTTAVAALGERAIDARALADNLQYFYQLEATLGLKLIDLRQGNPVEPAKDAAYSAVPYNVAVQGRYGEVLQFLRHLEQGQPLVRFTSANIALRPETASAEGAAPTGEPVLTLSLTVDLLGKS